MLHASDCTVSRACLPVHVMGTNVLQTCSDTQYASSTLAPELDSGLQRLEVTIKAI